MIDDQNKSFSYKRARFTTHLPRHYLYSQSHFWLENRGEDLWRVGFTKFSTRMLGELVDHGFEAKPDVKIESGEIIGWIEGFKAISDLYCAVNGTFVRANPILSAEIERVGKQPYSEGWLYEVRGEPDQKCFPLEQYIELLDETIDRILEKESHEEEEN